MWKQGRGKALVGAQGAKPPEAGEFSAYLTLRVSKRGDLNENNLSFNV
jgi:hypothetical protein